MDGELWLDLPFEESVMELLVVNVNLAHLWPNFLTHLGLHSFSILLQMWREIFSLLLVFHLASRCKPFKLPRVSHCWLSFVS